MQVTVKFGLADQSALSVSLLMHFLAGNKQQVIVCGLAG